MLRMIAPRPATCLMIFAGCVWAQPMLTVEDAIRIGLENNYSISLAHDQTAIAVNNRQGGVGPFLPGASANLSHSGLLDGTAPQTTVGASLNWDIFNGFQSYNAYHRLESEEKAASLQERVTLEQTLESILVSYYDIVQQKQKLAAIRELLAVSMERARLAEAKLEIGAGSRLDQLQSIADLNEDSSSFLSQEISLQKAKVNLNQILAREASTDFEVADSIPLQASLPLADWKIALAENNASIAAAKAQRNATEASVSESRGRYLPSLNAGLGYSAAPDALNSGSVPGRRDGFAYSVNLTVPIFDKLATPTAVRQANLQLRQDETRLKQTEASVLAEFETDRRQYDAGLRQAALEERNLQVARLQEEAAKERYRVGASSALEFRDAQRKLLDAEGRFIAARQSVKQSETALQRLAGALVRQRPAQSEGK